MRYKIVSLLIVVLLSVSFSSCRTIRLKLGIGYTVENPEPGTPEALMQNVLKVLTIKNPQKSWSKFLRLLHSHEREGGFINTWKKLKFAHMRKVARYYILDSSSYSFKIKRIREGLGDTFVLYLYSPQTEVPTPCKFKRDPKNGNEWRVYSSCL